MTIRLRLTLWYTALVGATLILFSVLVYSALTTNLYAQMEADSARQATTVSEFLSSQIQQGVRSAARVELPPLDFFASSFGVQLLGLNGELYTRSSNLGAMEVPVSAQMLAQIVQGNPYGYYTAGAGGGPMLIYSTPLKVGDEVIGAVQIIKPSSIAASAINQVSRYLILGTGLSLAIAALVGALLARRALAPLADITRTANSITRAQDLDQRLEIAEDENEVGQLAANFNEMLDRLERLFKAQERLVADVSHELRTPLTTVQGNMELLRRMASSALLSQPPSAETLELFSDIVNEVENETTRMSNLINDLLLLAQADSGVLKLRMETVEMDTLLLDVYRQARRIAESHKGPNALDIRLGAEDQALVRGDRERLRQLLLNLADNAIKYTPSGGFVTFSLENSNGWVKVAIQDNGIGISQEQQSLIFERFYRADKARSREQGGSGLGLSIVQWLAQAHNGHVTVQSALHQGSTFTVWLPEYVPNATTQPPAPPHTENHEEKEAYAIRPIA